MQQNHWQNRKNNIMYNMCTYKHKLYGNHRVNDITFTSRYVEGQLLLFLNL